MQIEDLEDIEEWVLIERKNDEGVVEVLARGSFGECREAAREYKGENEISMVPYDEFVLKARRIH